MYSNSYTSKFDSWTLLCQGTGKQYPTTDDIFYSPNYAKTPRGLKEQVEMSFETKPIVKTNADCRICKLLEKSGTHKKELYVNHYGNFPTHCPQWTKMNIAEIKKTSKLVKYCLRCFAPRLIIKKNMRSKHNKTKCYVSSSRKHKFTCLNKACLTHSWVCEDHIDENIPLIDAHHDELQMLTSTKSYPAAPTNPDLSSKKQRVFTYPKARTHLKCRICRILERSGKYEGELYINHYGHHPIHCPQWSKMSVDWRIHISRRAKYCLRCFSPKIVLENIDIDMDKHYGTECSVSHTNKHMLKA